MSPPPVVTKTTFPCWTKDVAVFAGTKANADVRILDDPFPTVEPWSDGERLGDLTSGRTLTLVFLAQGPTRTRGVPYSEVP